DRTSPMADLPPASPTAPPPDLALETTPDGSASSEPGSLVHENSAAAAAGVGRHFMYEVPLYSDTLVVGEVRDLGPYDLLNAVSNSVPDLEVDVSIFARVRLHGDHWFRPTPIDESQPIDHAGSRYHGGSHDEE